MEPLISNDGSSPVRDAASAQANLGRQYDYVTTRRFDPPEGVLERHRILGPHSDPAVADAYRILRTQVLQRMDGNRWNALAVVSPNAGEGKTTTAINLALSIARDPEHSALLVDMDLRAPGVAACFGLTAQPNLLDHLRKGVPLSEVLVNPGLERLLLLPTSASPLDSSEIIASRRSQELLAELRSRYADRIVVYDVPPLLLCDDGLALLPQVDVVLMVARDGVTRREDLSRALELLGDKPVLGVLLNGARDARRHYVSVKKP